MQPRNQAQSRLTVGTLVKFMFGGHEVQATVIEDRGPVGAKGRRILRIRLELAETEPLEFEVPADDVKVASHQTALALHGLSDVLPTRVHLTLPMAWRRRRFRVPADVLLHYADAPRKDRAWFGAVPATNARRSLNDCARAGLSPELLRQAAQQALRRGLVTQLDLGEVDAALKPFGGLTHDDSHIPLARGIQASARAANASRRRKRR